MSSSMNPMNSRNDRNNRNDRDDDEVSITSSLEEQVGSDEEWNIEAIVAEGTKKGETELVFLTQWTGYPIEDWTWEPRESFSEQSLKDWEAHKALVKRGEVAQYKIRNWREARKRVLKEKLERHERRNRKRKRERREAEITDSVGLIINQLAELDILPRDLDDVSDDSDDSDDDVDGSWILNLNSTKKLPSNEFPQFTSARLQSTSNSSTTTTTPTTPTTPTTRTPSTINTTTITKATNANAKVSCKANTNINPNFTTTTTTGYQGTARKSSLTQNLHLASSPPLPTPPSGQQEVAKIGAPDPSKPHSPNQTARRSKPRTIASGTGSSFNVFAGGKLPRQRQNGSNDEEKKKTNKNFDKYSDLRRIEKRSRNREDVAPQAPSGRFVSSLLSSGSGKQQPEQEQTASITENLPSAKKPSTARSPATVAAHQKFPTPTATKSPGGAKDKEAAKVSSVASSPMVIPSPMVQSSIITQSPPMIEDSPIVTSSTEAADSYFAHLAQMAPPIRKSSLISMARSEDSYKAGDTNANGGVNNFGGPDDNLRPTASKKVKSVHWSTDDDDDDVSHVLVQQVAADMDLESSGLFVTGSRVAGKADPSDSSFNRQVEKIVTIGPKQHSRRVHCLFDQVIANRSESWLSLFLTQDVLNFSQRCRAQDFQSRSPDILRRVICQGSLLAATDNAENAEVETMLANAAERLGLGSYGVAFNHQDYAILLYPTNCEEWREFSETPPPTNESKPETLANVSLRFVIFEPNPCSKPIHPRTAQLMSGGSLLNSSIPVRGIVLKKFFGLDYKKLVPSALANLWEEHRFLLVMAPRSDQLNAFWAWLEQSNPKCKVLLAHSPGHWQDFLSQTSGCVIVQESYLPLLRRFPRLSALLSKPHSRFTFWLQQDAVLEKDGNRKIGQLAVKSLFPYGDVALLTPSFILAHPEQAHNCILWLSRNWDHHKLMWKIAVPSGINDHIRDLAYADRLAAQAAMGADFDPPPPSNAYYRKEAWFMVDRLLRRNHTRHLQLEVDGQRGRGRMSYLAHNWTEARMPMIVASNLIDANDEQSLVNWFGWWSLANANKYRRFIVIGSEECPPHPLRSEIRMPKYLPGTVNNPDEQWKPALLSSSHLEGATAETASTSSSPAVMQMLSSDSAWELKKMLDSLDAQMKAMKYQPLYLYKAPVSYCDLKLADLVGDVHVEYATFANWWGHFHLGLMKGNRNAYCGFFYTPSEESDARRQSSDISGSSPVRRDPWLAIFRPVNPRRRQEEGYQLLIWDPSTIGKFRDRERDGWVSQADILEAQRKLSRFLMDHIESKCGTGFEDVWIGGRKRRPAGANELRHPVDVTLQLINMMARDPDELKEWFPLTSRHLRNKGWLRVDFKAPATREQYNKTDKTDRTDRQDKTDKTAEAVGVNKDDGSSVTVDPDFRLVDDGPDGKMIFHAPPGLKKYFGLSRCTNRLYEAASTHVATDPSAPFRYTFLPTQEWYLQQKAEGRHFEHVEVGSWEYHLANFNKRMAIREKKDGERKK